MILAKKARTLVDCAYLRIFAVTRKKSDESFIIMASMITTGYIQAKPLGTGETFG